MLLIYQLVLLFLLIVFVSFMINKHKAIILFFVLSAFLFALEFISIFTLHQYFGADFVNYANLNYGLSSTKLILPTLTLTLIFSLFFYITLNTIKKRFVPSKPFCIISIIFLLLLLNSHNSIIYEIRHLWIDDSEMVQKTKFSQNRLAPIQMEDTSRFIAHAGGELDGNKYTESLEALNNSYKNGFKLFELDIRSTEDGVFVASHKWKQWAALTN